MAETAANSKCVQLRLWAHTSITHTLISLSEANTTAFLTNRENADYEIPQISPGIKSVGSLLPGARERSLPACILGPSLWTADACTFGLLFYLFMMLPYHFMDKHGLTFFLQFHKLTFT